MSVRKHYKRRPGKLVRRPDAKSITKPPGFLKIFPCAGQLQPFSRHAALQNTEGAYGATAMHETFRVSMQLLLRIANYTCRAWRWRRRRPRFVWSARQMMCFRSGPAGNFFLWKRRPEHYFAVRRHFKRRPNCFVVRIILNGGSTFVERPETF